MNQNETLNLYNQAIDYLGLSLLENRLIDLLKTNQDFKTTTCSLLSFVIDCEDNKKVDAKNQDWLLSGFNAITNNAYQPNTSISLMTSKEVSNLLKEFDEILIKNFDLTFAQIKAEFHETHKETPQKVENEAIVNDTPAVGIGEINNGSTNQNNNNTNRNSNGFDGEKFIEHSGMSINDFADSMIQNYAANILALNIRKGSVYQFKTKPKVVPIMKWFIVAIIILLLIFSVATYALLMVAGQKLVYKYTNNEQELVEDTGWPLTSVFPFQMITTILILTMMLFSLIRNNKNENVKYSISWIWTSFYILILVLNLFLFGGLEQTQLLFNKDEFFAKINLVFEKSREAIKYIDAYRIIQFISIGLIGLLIIFLVVAALFNPKRDIERLNALLDSYVNDIKNGVIPFDSSDMSNGFGGFGGLF